MSRCIGLAHRLAGGNPADRIEVGHLVMSLLEEAEVRVLLRKLNIDIANVRLALAPHWSYVAAETSTEAPILASIEAMDLLKQSITFMRDRGKSGTNPVAVLRSFMAMPQSQFLPMISLMNLGLGVDRIDAWIDQQPRIAALRERKIPEALLAYCSDLVIEACDGRMEAVHGREEEVAHVARILRRRKKNNPILVGEPGVGKTAVVEGLALMIAEGTAGPGLNDARILALNVTSILGGTRNRGELEERLNIILKHMEEDSSLILFIDETHVIVGGATGFTDAANLLKPALASGRIRCIGATTHGEYAKYFDSDPALSRRFLPVDIREPTPEEASVILRAVSAMYAGHHGVTYDDKAITSAVELSVRHVLTRRLPDKAIDAIDEAGALAASEGSTTVDERHIIAAISRACGRDISADGPTVPALAASLKELVRGQDNACDEIASVLGRSQSPLAAPRGARASLLISGPTGSGKNRIAEAIGQALGLKVHTLDMGEFRSEVTVTRLIGPPPGYVGYGAGGRLTEIARRHPASVILLDRMELAHPDVHGIIGQAMRNGMLRDTSDRVISFGGIVFVMAVGVNASEVRSFGFAPTADALTPSNGLEGIFDPSFLGSVDLITNLSPMGREAIKMIACDLVTALIQRVQKHGLPVVIDDVVIDKVVDEVLKANAGAKPIQRVFRNEIENPLIDYRSGLMVSPEEVPSLAGGNT